MTSKELLGRYAKQLRDAFAPLIARDRPLALADFPDSINCGEHSIWLGEKRLLSELGLATAYECSAQTYDRNAMAAKIGDGTILIQGGGNFGGRYPSRHEFRLRVLQDFPNNKIIFFPQQMASLKPEYLERTANLLAQHSDVTLFARSIASQRTLEECFAQKARVQLAPDMAFLLPPQTRAAEPLYDIVWLARTDEERTNDQTEAAARLSSQAAEKFALPRFADGVEIHAVVKQRPPTVLLTDWSSLIFENEDARLAYRRLAFDARSKASVDRALYVLSLGRIVITDRLHAHIFCLLMGIPHVLLEIESGKNGDFHETWTRQANLCRLAHNPAEAWSLARAALPRLKEWKGGEWSWQDTQAAASVPN